MNQDQIELESVHLSALVVVMIAMEEKEVVVTAVMETPVQVAWF
jgi:hypothetical protein